MKDHPQRESFEKFYDSTLREKPAKYDLAWQAWCAAQQSVQRTAFAAFCGGTVFGLFIGFVLVGALL